MRSLRHERGPDETLPASVHQSKTWRSVAPGPKAGPLDAQSHGRLVRRRRQQRERPGDQEGRDSRSGMCRGSSGCIATAGGCLLAAAVVAF